VSRHPIIRAFPLLVALVVLPGCPSAPALNYEKTVDMEPGDIKLYTIDAPRRDQKIRVETDSAEAIDVTVALESDAEAVKKFLSREVAGSNPPWLARKESNKHHSLDTEVPAGKSFTVLLSGAKKRTEVKLKVKSQ